MARSPLEPLRDPLADGRSAKSSKSVVESIVAQRGSVAAHSGFVRGCERHGAVISRLLLGYESSGRGRREVPAQPVPIKPGATGGGDAPAYGWSAFPTASLG